MQTNVLVTGATGCVGANVVKHLNERSLKPRVLLRRTSKTLAIDDLDWEPVYGDMTDRPSLERAVKGCTTVYHTAALITFWRRRWQEAERVNVQGTRDLLEVSRRAGVKAFAYTSTMSAVGFCEKGQQTVNEDSPFNYRPFRLVYNSTKREAEEIVLGASTDEFRTFSINPGLIFGERDVNLSAARMFDIAKRWYPFPFANPGSVTVADADDVAEGHLLAVERGRPGHRYIVGTKYVTYLELVTWVCEMVGRKPPLITIPAWAVKSVGVLGEIYGMVTGREPMITYDMALIGCQHQRADVTKAIEELGLEPTDVMTSLEKSYRWVIENGIIKG